MLRSAFQTSQRLRSRDRAMRAHEPQSASRSEAVAQLSTIAGPPSPNVAAQLQSEMFSSRLSRFNAMLSIYFVKKNKLSRFLHNNVHMIS